MTLAAGPFIPAKNVIIRVPGPLVMLTKPGPGPAPKRRGFSLPREGVHSYRGKGFQAPSRGRGRVRCSNMWFMPAGRKDVHLSVPVAFEAFIISSKYVVLGVCFERARPGRRFLCPTKTRSAWNAAVLCFHFPQSRPRNLCLWPGSVAGYPIGK